MAGLPQLLQLQKTYPDQLVAIAWNLDQTDPQGAPTPQQQQEVNQKLTELNLQVQNVMAREPIDVVLAKFSAFSLPCLAVYGPDGRLLQKFEGDFSYEADVAPFIRSVLTGAPPPSTAQ